MKKIAIIASSFPPSNVGGIASSHYNLYRRLKARGDYDVRVFTFMDQPVEEFEEDIIRHRSSDFIEKQTRRFGSWFFYILEGNRMAWNITGIISASVGARRMNRSLKKFRPDIVVLPDHSLPGLWLSKQRKMRICMISHHNPARFLGELLLGDFSERDARWAIALENRVLRKVDKVSCPSRYMQGLFRETYSYTGKVEVIPNVIDQDLLQEIEAKDLRAEMGLGPERVLICMPAVGFQLKGSDYVAEIVRRVGKGGGAAFYIPGIFTNKLKRQLETVSRDIEIYLPGNLPYLEHLANLKSCSFSISSSIHENYSMALVESVASGVPMITWDSGGNEDIVADGRNGYLIADYDVEDLVEKASMLVEQPEKLVELRSQTMAYARSAFDPEQTTQQYIDYFIESE